VLADGGTLFLDEIGELPPEVQAKLLRVLQDGVVEPISAAKGRTIKVRIVVASNRDLRQEVKEKRFREDLFYRIEIGTIYLPLLRERRSDIAFLAMWGIDNINTRLKTPKRLSRRRSTH
jgi:transcriptional regulator with GAF, ATPase, and Fis domain